MRDDYNFIKEMTDEALQFIEKAAVALKVNVPQMYFRTNAEMATNVAISLYVLINEALSQQKISFMDDLLDVIAEACQKERMYADVFPQLVLNLYVRGRDETIWRNPKTTRRMLRQLGFSEFLK